MGLRETVVELLQGLCRLASARYDGSTHLGVVANLQQLHTDLGQGVVTSVEPARNGDDYRFGVVSRGCSSISREEWFGERCVS